MNPDPRIRNSRITSPDPGGQLISDPPDPQHGKNIGTYLGNFLSSLLFLVDQEVFSLLNAENLSETEGNKIR
jgi:hypothetical protein